MANLRIASALRHGRIGLVDRRLNLGEQLGIAAQVAQQSRTCRGRGPGRNGLRVQGDQSGDERPTIADDHALADQAMGANPVLEDGRRDILSARGDQYFLFSSGDADKTVVVDLPDVARTEPVIV